MHLIISSRVSDLAFKAVCESHDFMSSVNKPVLSELPWWRTSSPRAFFKHQALPKRWWEVQLLREKFVDSNCQDVFCFLNSPLATLWDIKNKFPMVKDFEVRQNWLQVLILSTAICLIWTNCSETLSIKGDDNGILVNRKVQELNEIRYVISHNAWLIVITQLILLLHIVDLIIPLGYLCSSFTICRCVSLMPPSPSTLQPKLWALCCKHCC